MMETLSNNLDLYSNQLPPLSSASSPSLVHSPGPTGLDGSKKYTAMSLFNNNVMNYGNPGHISRKYGGNGSPERSPLMGGGSCGPGDYSMGGLTSYSYGSPYDSLAGFGQSMGGNGHMGSEAWPSPHPPPPPHPPVSHHMQLGPPVGSNVHDTSSSSSSSAVAAAAALQAAMQVCQPIFQ